nr:MAG TPA: hypothetical protein [Bacteriophage sp.]
MGFFNLFYIVLYFTPVNIYGTAYITFSIRGVNYPIYSCIHAL